MARGGLRLLLAAWLKVLHKVRIELLELIHVNLGENRFINLVKHDILHTLAVHVQIPTKPVVL